MKKIIATMLLAATIGVSCSSTSTSIFSKKTPLEKYEEKLEDSGLAETPEGRLWLAASEAAIQAPQLIQLPYRHLGNFPTGKPRALGLQFAAKRGERLTFNIDKNAVARFVLYAELFRQDENGNTELLHAEDTAASEFDYAIAETGNYILKLQPQLFRSGSYSLSISVGPSLHFPVAGGKANVGSFWGADRDGGKRSHEGIDIFAAKRTPAVAAADGYITAVREGGIGGKTVWLRPVDQAFTLYYAHLDEQLVQPGQFVKKGETIGLVGNTGNARTTPPHLHFGIYGYGGAVDPFPFVNKKMKTAPAIPEKKSADLVRLLKAYKTGDVIAKTNTLLVPVALTSNGYIAELPDGRMIQTSFASVQSTVKPLKNTKAVTVTTVYKTPVKDAASTMMIQAGSSVSVLGYFNEFTYVKSGEKEGWVLGSELKG
jgi:hypothetical protein